MYGAFHEVLRCHSPVRLTLRHGDYTSLKIETYPSCILEVWSHCHVFTIAEIIKWSAQELKYQK